MLLSFHFVLTYNLYSYYALCVDISGYLLTVYRTRILNSFSFRQIIMMVSMLLNVSKEGAQTKC